MCLKNTPSKGAHSTTAVLGNFSFVQEFHQWPGTGEIVKLYMYR